MRKSTSLKPTVLITGASGQLGGALCHEFSSAAGYRIGVHFYHHSETGQKVVETLNKSGADALLLTADLRDPASVRKMFDRLERIWGGLDILINNAGITDHSLLAKSDSGDWDDVVGVNLSGAFYCIREAGRLMHRAGRGHIINISSFAAYTGRSGQPAYTAAKRGLIALTQTMAKEWGDASIQVNAVLPGFLDSGMTARLKAAGRQKIVGENVLGRSSTLKEVSGFVVYLSRMEHVSGQVFNLDSRIL